MAHTELSREQLKENRTVVPLSELKPWQDNPREVINEDRVIADMKGVQTIPLLVMSDGTVLGGNTRFGAMRKIGKHEAWVSVIEFEAENGHFVAYINGERDLKTFNTIKDGMKHYALKSNQEYARYLDMEVVEVILDTELDLSEYSMRKEDGSLVTLQDLMNESDGIETIEIEEAKDRNKEPTQAKDNKPKISYSVTFDIAMVKSTTHEAFEDWLNTKMDEMMLSLLDQFKQVKDTL